MELSGCLPRPRPRAGERRLCDWCLLVVPDLCAKFSFEKLSTLEAVFLCSDWFIRKVFVCPVLERVRGWVRVQFTCTRVGQEISTRSWTTHGNNWALADKRRIYIERGRLVVLEHGD